eukprot:maker-scaffold358_size197577-snap-gene-0.80 protein:Tk00161 transcript:maker-scaffold358_size197577-snap-gene-0.80-mRNA-1 annotation:"elongation factor 4"
MPELKNIRNFSIVAHIDHGKSTLADRLIQETNTVALRDMKAQMLDSMDIERERGITIKANTVRIDYTADNGESYVLNLIDTPGHVDFAYEVSRSMRAVEGSLLVVDSTQGVEAQTLANAMLVDSWYDSYLGVIVLVRIIDGRMKKNDRVRFMSNDTLHQIDRIGVFRPQMMNVDTLGPGEIGFITASIKQVRDTRVGDTITSERKGTDKALPGFKPAQPVVFCGLFPVDSSQFEDLRDAIDKLALNDASFSFEMETSAALGFGFRCGFLGLLHLEVIRDRIEREYDIELITTAPSVVYHVYMKDGSQIDLHNPADMPDATTVDHLEEPRIKATILVPDDYLGDVLKLCQDRRGVQMDLTYAGSRAMVVYDLPLNEVVFDFYDRLKSVTKGYASFDYVLTGYQTDNLVKMSVLVNDEPVDALSMMVHRDRAEQRGRAMVEKLKDLIPRHMFKIPIQAAIGGKVIARETLSALRKDVTAKCYGGDATRKRKLLDKQKAGKKKMRQFGRVEIPQEAFISALKMDS